MDEQRDDWSDALEPKGEQREQPVATWAPTFGPEAEADAIRQQSEQRWWGWHAPGGMW